MSISVLVADDSPTIRRRAQATLGDAGFDVHCVEDGEKAWEEMDGGRKVDVLLCDILMPRLDGYGLCGRVKGDARFASLPVLLLRGTFEPWDEAKAHDAGADGFITKPFEPENLVGTVRDVLESVEDEARTAPAPAAEAPPETVPAAPAVEESADPFGSADAGADAAPFEAEDDPLHLGDDAPAEAAAAPAPPAPAPAPAAAPPSGGAAPSAASPVEVGSLDDAALEALARKVAEKLAGDVIEKLAWDVVPEVAEALVRKRMIEIESKLQGS